MWSEMWKWQQWNIAKLTQFEKKMKRCFLNGKTKWNRWIFLLQFFPQRNSQIISTNNDLLSLKQKQNEWQNNWNRVDGFWDSHTCKQSSFVLNGWQMFFARWCLSMSSVKMVDSWRRTSSLAGRKNSRFPLTSIPTCLAFSNSFKSAFPIPINPQGENGFFLISSPPRNPNKFCLCGIQRTKRFTEENIRCLFFPLVSLDDFSFLWLKRSAVLSSIGKQDCCSLISILKHEKNLFFCWNWEIDPFLKKKPMRIPNKKVCLPFRFVSVDLQLLLYFSKLMEWSRSSSSVGFLPSDWTFNCW